MAEQTLNKSRELIQLTPNSKLIFQHSSEKVTTFLALNNTTSSKIAFKLKTTSPYDFTVCPSKGFITPYSCTKVKIILLPISGVQKRRHKFLVQAKSATTNDFTKIDWKDPNIEVHKLRVVFENLSPDDINSDLDSIKTTRSETLYTESDKNENPDFFAPLKATKKRKRKGKRRRLGGYGKLHIMLAFIIGILVGIFGSVY
ncbi:unnamed protein product [Blepharisma stoltei]|uniref:MSP domain-containing protein n=1 Tax=Blepharisma stoltei TaxID=1481888 RepID=A0AAU9IGQ7_9CILI|nr:unnamed protein product [Blepharisma stoltei]